MTNELRSRNLLWYTRELLREMREHLERGVWNGVVRRGQEAVEASLKSVMLHLGADYPKTHDPGPALVRLVRQRGVPVDQQRLRRATRLSGRLARSRGPAGYVEILCSETDARDAADGAEEAFALATEICGAPPDGPFRPDQGA